MNDYLTQELRIQKLVFSLKIVGAFILAGAIGFAGYGAYVSYQKKEAQKAFSLLYKADQIEELAAKEAQPLSSDALSVMKSWGDDKKKNYVETLQSVLSAAPKSVAAHVARLRLAKWNLTLGQFAEARIVYQELVSLTNSSNLDSVFYKSIALEGVGQTFEEEKNFAEAEKFYSTALALKNNPLKPVSYFSKARVQKLLNKNAEAKLTYEEIIKEFSGTRFERKARVLLGIQKL